MSDQSEYELSSHIDGLRLMRAFSRIEGHAKRRAVIVLAEQLAGGSPSEQRPPLLNEIQES